VDKGIDDQVLAAGIVMHKDGFSPLPADSAKALESVDGVSEVSAVRFATGKVRDAGNQQASGVDPRTAPDVLRLKVESGPGDALAKLTDDTVIVPKDFADGHDLGVGRTLHVTTPLGKQRDYRVIATYDANVGVVGGFVLTNDALARDWNAKDIAYALVTARSTSTREARRAGGIAASTPASAARTISHTSVNTGTAKAKPSSASGRETIAAKATPSTSPRTAPITAVITASARTIRRTWRRVMPPARSMPSSRVRSCTDSARVFTMPSSATITDSESSA
jgi:hypothetical protein